MTGLLRPLRVRDFRLLFGGESISVLGDHFHFVALASDVAADLLAEMGSGAGFINVHVISWLQGRTTEEMRGRVMSLVMLGAVGLAPLSYALAGAVVDLGPVPLMFGVAGAIVVAASVAGFASGAAGQITYADAEAAA